MLVQPRDDEIPVTIATFALPHDAELARIALESRGVTAIIQHDHGMYPTSGAWVHLQVPAGECELAGRLLERSDVAESGPRQPSASSEPDDMRRLRLSRRFTLGRWFLYTFALSLFLTIWITGPLFLVPLGLAVWARRDPRRAFATAFLLQVAVLCLSIVFTGPSGLGAAIPLVAFYWAWTGATPEPPETLLSSPYPRTPAVEIGQAWKFAGAAREPQEQPIWFLRVLGVMLIVLFMVWVISEAIQIG